MKNCVFYGVLICFTNIKFVSCLVKVLTFLYFWKEKMEGAMGILVPYFKFLCRGLFSGICLAIFSFFIRNIVSVKKKKKNRKKNEIWIIFCDINYPFKMPMIRINHFYMVHWTCSWLNEPVILTKQNLKKSLSKRKKQILNYVNQVKHLRNK